MTFPPTSTRKNPVYRIWCAFLTLLISVNLILPSGIAYAQLIPSPMIALPAPGMMVNTSAAYVPLMLRGVTVNPENPLELDFIVDTGDTNLQGEALKTESLKVIKYFFAALTVPQEDMWVNLSPYEADRIVPEVFGQTEMGRDMLAQDYLLKQLTASLMFPDETVGKEFWSRVYAKARELYGRTDLPFNTFNKVWITPKAATVYENGRSALLADESLEVMLEKDYVALQENMGDARFGMKSLSESQINETDALTAEMVREVLIPEIEKEVNSGETFANLRQIYSAMVLAWWYKQALKESLLGQVYVDRQKIVGVDVEDPVEKEKIYEQYLNAFKQGVYNFIKEEPAPETGNTIPRKYFSGGAVMGAAIPSKTKMVRLSMGTIRANPVSEERWKQIKIRTLEVQNRTGAQQANIRPADSITDSTGSSPVSKDEVVTALYGFISTVGQRDLAATKGAFSNLQKLPALQSFRVSNPSINEQLRIIQTKLDGNELPSAEFRGDLTSTAYAVIDIIRADQVVSSPISLEEARETLLDIVRNIPEVIYGEATKSQIVNRLNQLENIDDVKVWFNRIYDFAYGVMHGLGKDNDPSIQNFRKLAESLGVDLDRRPSSSSSPISLEDAKAQFVEIVGGFAGIKELNYSSEEIQAIQSAVSGMTTKEELRKNVGDVRLQAYGKLGPLYLFGFGSPQLATHEKVEEFRKLWDRLTLDDLNEKITRWDELTDIAKLEIIEDLGVLKIRSETEDQVTKILENLKGRSSTPNVVEAINNLLDKKTGRSSSPIIVIEEARAGLIAIVNQLPEEFFVRGEVGRGETVTRYESYGSIREVTREADSLRRSILSWGMGSDVYESTVRGLAREINELISSFDIPVDLAKWKLETILERRSFSSLQVGDLEFESTAQIRSVVSRLYEMAYSQKINFGQTEAFEQDFRELLEFQSLLNQTSSSPVDPLQNLNSEDRALRLQAIRELAVFENDSAIAPLSERLGSESDPEVRGAILNAMDVIEGVSARSVSSPIADHHRNELVNVIQPILQQKIQRVVSELQEAIQSYFGAAKDSDDFKKVDKIIAGIVDDLNKFDQVPVEDLSLARNINKLDDFMKSADFKRYLERAEAHVLNGQYVGRFIFAGAATRFGGPLYFVNLWDVAKKEGMAAAGEDLYSLGMGPRQLVAFRMAIEELARNNNIDAAQVLAKQKLIIHTNQEVHEQILEDFKKNNFYGFNRDNIFFIMQPALPGFRLENGELILDETIKFMPYGHGYNLMQLGQKAVAVQIDPNGSIVTFSDDVLSQLSDDTIIVSHRINDLTKFLTSEVIGLEKLAYRLYLHETGKNFVGELVGNPDKQKGGSVLQYERNGQIKKFLIETLNAKGLPALNRLVEQAGAEGAPYNAFRVSNMAGQLKSVLNKITLPYSVRFKEGYIYSELVTGDMSQVDNVDADFFLKQDELIHDFKEMKHLPDALNFVIAQDRELAKADALERSAATRLAEIKSEISATLSKNDYQQFVFKNRLNEIRAAIDAAATLSALRSTIAKLGVVAELQNYQSFLERAGNEKVSEVAQDLAAIERILNQEATASSAVVIDKARELGQYPEHGATFRRELGALIDEYNRRGSSFYNDLTSSTRAKGTPVYELAVSELLSIVTAKQTSVSRVKASSPIQEQITTILAPIVQNNAAINEYLITKQLSDLASENTEAIEIMLEVLGSPSGRTEAAKEKVRSVIAQALVRNQSNLKKVLDADDAIRLSNSEHSVVRWVGQQVLVPTSQVSSPIRQLNAKEMEPFVTQLQQDGAPANVVISLDQNNRPQRYRPTVRNNLNRDLNTGKIIAVRWDNENRLVTPAVFQALTKQEASSISSLAQPSDKRGGIDFNPQFLNLIIKRDDNGVPLPVQMQPIPMIESQIQGIVPVIINITPVTSLPMALGFNDTGDLLAVKEEDI